MNSNDSAIAAQEICHAANAVRMAWLEAAWERQRPSVLFQPRLSKDGDMWCALFGRDLMEGVAGFGDTPERAMFAFDAAWLTEGGHHVIDKRSKTDD